MVAAVVVVGAGGADRFLWSGANMITTDMKLRSLHRELEMRRRVYAKQVDSGKMSFQTATHEIEVMEAILKDYEKIKDDENAQATHANRPADIPSG
jgi:hypothetical protein